MNRQRSRELALQVMFQLEFTKDDDFAGGLEVFRVNFNVDKDVWEYARQILTGIKQNQGKIDSAINDCSAHWSLSRMALVDVNILRIALYEMMFNQQDVPPKVSINEALELAKRYSTTESASFINGVLDQGYKGIG